MEDMEICIKAQAGLLIAHPWSAVAWVLFSRPGQLPIHLEPMEVEVGQVPRRKEGNRCQEKRTGSGGRTAVTHIGA